MKLLNTKNGWVGLGSSAERPGLGAHYGIWDKAGQFWIGDDAGPKVLDDYSIARVAAQMCDMQLGNPDGQCEAREINTEGLRRTGSAGSPKMDALTALRRLEDSNR